MVLLGHCLYVLVQGELRGHLVLNVELLCCIKLSVFVLLNKIWIFFCTEFCIKPVICTTSCDYIGNIMCIDLQFEWFAVNLLYLFVYLWDLGTVYFYRYVQQLIIVHGNIYYNWQCMSFCCHTSICSLMIYTCT